MRSVILDLNMGMKDALALLLALRSPELDVLGVSIVSGREPADAGAQKALQMLELLNRVDVPVHVGGERPLSTPPPSLNAVPHEPPLPSVDPDMLPAGEATALLLDSIHARPGEVALLCTGALTNLAVAEIRRPGTLRRARRVFVVGTLPGLTGAASDSSGAVDLTLAEDPRAFAVVLDSGANVTWVPGSTSLVPALSLEQIPESSRQARDTIPALIASWLELRSAAGVDPCLHLHAALAVAFTLQPDLCDLETVSVNVAPLRAGGARRTGPAGEGGLVQIERVKGVDAGRFLELIRKRLFSI